MMYLISVTTFNYPVRTLRALSRFKEIIVQHKTSTHHRRIVNIEKEYLTETRFINKTLCYCRESAMHSSPGPSQSGSISLPVKKGRHWPSHYWSGL